jgi:hypothetical protein
MTHNSLGLSTAQQNLIVNAADQVPPQWRSRFMEAVADQLMGTSVVTNDNVHDAIIHVRSRMRAPHDKNGEVAEILNRLGGAT